MHMIYWWWGSIRSSGYYNSMWRSNSVSKDRRDRRHVITQFLNRPACTPEQRTPWHASSAELSIKVEIRVMCQHHFENIRKLLEWRSHAHFHCNREIHSSEYFGSTATKKALLRSIKHHRARVRIRIPIYHTNVKKLLDIVPLLAGEKLKLIKSSLKNGKQDGEARFLPTNSY